jgi:hypothetical protein
MFEGSLSLNRYQLYWCSNDGVGLGAMLIVSALDIEIIVQRLNQTAALNGDPSIVHWYDKVKENEPRKR